MEDMDMYLKITKHDIVAKFCAFILHTIIVRMGTCKNCARKWINKICYIIINL